MVQIQAIQNYEVVNEKRIINQTDPIDKTKPYCIAYYENNTVRDKQNLIGKYNYTIMKNNLDPTNPIIPNFNPGIWDVIRSETADDGDKALAAKFCTNFNQTKDPLHLNLAGWLVKQIFYFMFCNPKDVLENTGVYILLKDENFGNPTVKTEILDILLKKLKDLKSANPDLFDIVTIASQTKTLYVKKDKYQEFNTKIASTFRTLKIDVNTEFISKLRSSLPQKITEQVANIMNIICDDIKEHIKISVKKLDDTSPLKITFTKPNYFNIKIPDIIKFLLNTTPTIPDIQNILSTNWKHKIDPSPDYMTYLQTISTNLKQIAKNVKEYLEKKKDLTQLNTDLQPLLIDLYKFFIYTITIYNLVTDSTPKPHNFIDIKNNNISRTYINTPHDEFNSLINTQSVTHVTTFLGKDKIREKIEYVDESSLVSKSTIQKLNDDFIQLGGNDDTYFKAKYLKYKQKYLQLKSITK